MGYRAGTDRTDGDTGQIAAAVLWLCSDAASFVIGHAMVVDAAKPSHADSHADRDHRPGGNTHADHPQLSRRRHRHHEGAAEWFTGDVYVDRVAASPAPSRVRRSWSTSRRALAPPGAATHSDRASSSPEGIGLLSASGGTIEVIWPATGSIDRTRSTGTEPPPAG